MAKKSLKDACWDGYEAYGTKVKNGRTVPNCVPKRSAAKGKAQARKKNGK